MALLTANIFIAKVIFVDIKNYLVIVIDEESSAEKKLLILIEFKNALFVMNLDFSC